MFFVSFITPDNEINMLNTKSVLNINLYNLLVNILIHFYHHLYYA